MPKLALHEEPVRDLWRHNQVHWHAFSLPHCQSRPDQRDQRLAELPIDAVLLNPVDVTLWVERQYQAYAPTSQPESWLVPALREDAQERLDYRRRTNMIVASRGDSLYVDIKHCCQVLHRRAPTVRQLWVEAVREQECPAALHGHERPEMEVLHDALRR